MLPALSLPSHAETAQQVQFAQLIALVRRNLRLIIFCTLAAAIAGWAIGRMQKPFYTASGMIMVEGDSFAIPELQGALRSGSSGDAMPMVRSEVEALYSRELLQQVVDQLGLAHMPEFNPMLRPPTLRERITDWITSFFPSAEDDDDDQPQQRGVSHAEADAVIGQVTQDLIVFNDNRSLVISLEFTAHDPQLASDVVNAIINDYVQSRARNRNAINQGANAALVQQTDQVRGEIAQLEAQIRTLRSQNGLVALPSGSATQQQLAELATAAAHASVERAQLEATWNKANSLAQRGAADELASVVGAGSVAAMREQEEQAARRVATLSTHYGPNYPEVVGARADLAAAHQQVEAEIQRIVASLGTQLRVARQQEAEAQHQVDAARQTSVKTANQQAQLEELQQEVQARRSLYQSLLESSQQTSARSGTMQTPDIRVVSLASPPGFPSGPNAKRAGMLGGLAGAVLGCVLGLTRIRSVGPFSNAGAATATTGLPVLAVLRSLGRQGSSSLVSRVLANPTGPDAEALRIMRTRLRLAGSAGGSRSVAFMSAETGEGAPGVAAAFARIAALDGERVLLIEGNIRAPALQLMLEARSANLLTVLEAQHSWRDAVTRDADTPLDLLLASQQTLSGHVLLRGNYLQTLLLEAREHYSWIVVDSPPAALTSDALSLAHSVDAAVLVIGAKTANRSAVQESIARLTAIAQNLAGIALIEA